MPLYECVWEKQLYRVGRTISHPASVACAGSEPGMLFFFPLYCTHLQIEFIDLYTQQTVQWDSHTPWRMRNISLQLEAHIRRFKHTFKQHMVAPSTHIDTVLYQKSW